MSPARMLALLVLLSACGTSAPPPEPDCSTPRGATDSLLVWQSPDHFNAAKATKCTEPVPGRDNARLARKLKEVLDARGLYVPVSTLPSEHDYTNDDGVAQVLPLGDTFPLVIRRGDDGAWRYARETLEAAPTLHAQTFSPMMSWARERLPPGMFRTVGPLAMWQLAFGLLLVVVATLTGRIFRAVISQRAFGLAERFGGRIDPEVYARTNRPMVWFISLAVLAWGLPQLQLPIEISRVVVGAADLLLRLAGIWAALAFLEVVVDVAHDMAERTDSKLDDQLIPLLRQAARFVIGVFGLLFVLESVGVDVWKLLAGVSIGSLVIALAAQDTVANVFGSINVFVDRPFQIGDWVKVGDVEGVVEEVGFRSTRVRTFYNSMVTVPNSKLTSANVDNLGVRPRRRVKLTLGLTYDTPPDKLQAYAEGVRAILAAHPDVEKTYEVHVYDLSSSSIDILVYYHLVTPGWHEELTVRAANILEFIRLAEALEVSFAFPSTSVYLESTPDKGLDAHAPRTKEELQALIDAFGPQGSKARPTGPSFRSWSAQQVTKMGS